MPRKPVGTTPQESSATALAAHIASRLADVGSDRRKRDRWLRHDLNLKVGSNGLDRAAPRAGGAVEPWLLVRESDLPLNLEKALVVFPGQGRRRRLLLGRLADLGVTRQLLITRSRRDVACVLLFRQGERDELFAALEALNEPFFWDDILEEERGIEATAWMALAQRAASAENLLTIGPEDERPDG